MDKQKNAAGTIGDARETFTSRLYQARPTDAIAEFTAAIYEPDDLVEVRILRAGEARTHAWCRAEALASHAPELEKLNGGGWNIHPGVNPRHAHQRGDTAVKLARVLFADHDHSSIEQASRCIRDAGMPAPTLMMASGGGVHSYWRLAEPLTPEHWRTWQLDLAAMLGSDPKISNPERLGRLPGFANHKYDPPIPATIIDADPTRVYGLADLPIPMRPGSDTPPPIFAVRRIVRDTGTMDWVERCRRYLDKIPGAVAGAGGHRMTWTVANTCNRMGLTEGQASDVMREYAQRCDPPWSEREIRHKVADAYRRNHAEHGAKFHEHRPTARRIARVMIGGAA